MNDKFIKYNPNPINNRVGDCTVRAISKILCQDWDDTYISLCIEGLMMCDMPSANSVWGAYLRSKGFHRMIIPDDIQDFYTVNEFCEDHPKGDFILALEGHVIAVSDGKFYDTWDSSNEIPLYYWIKKEDK